MDENILKLYGIFRKKIEEVQGSILRNYSELTEKPKVNGVELNGEVSFKTLGITELSNIELEEMIQNIGGL